MFYLNKLSGTSGVFFAAWVIEPRGPLVGLIIHHAQPGGAELARNLHVLALPLTFNNLQRKHKPRGEDGVFRNRQTCAF